MDDEILRLDRQICFRLYKISRTMTRLYQPILEPLKLTYPQYVTMLVMWEMETIDFKELGNRLDLKTGTLTPIIINMEKRGYLYREKNSKDNRRIWVKITEAGKELKKQALKVPETLLTSVNMNLNQYKKYEKVLDELGKFLERAEIKQKKKVKK